MQGSNGFSLSGKRIAVVGGTGLIGAAVVDACTILGGHPVVLDLKAPEKSHPPVDFVQFDISHYLDPASTLDRIESRVGVLDAWVYSAYPRTPDYGTQAAEAAQATQSFRTNLELQLNCACIWATAMAERLSQRESGGAIVQLASVYGVVGPDPRLYDGLGLGAGTPAVYSAAKGGIIAHARHLAAKFAPSVRVNVVCPGGVSRAQSAAFRTRYAERVPVKRFAEPSEIGWPVAFLLSDGASYCTGTVLMVDGGMTAI